MTSQYIIIKQKIITNELSVLLKSINSLIKMSNKEHSLYMYEIEILHPAKLVNYAKCI